MHCNQSIDFGTEFYSLQYLPLKKEMMLFLSEECSMPKFESSEKDRLEQI